MAEDDWSYRLFSSPEEANRWMDRFIAEQKRKAERRRRELIDRAVVAGAIVGALVALLVGGAPMLGWW